MCGLFLFVFGYLISYFSSNSELISELSLGMICLGVFLAIIGGHTRHDWDILIGIYIGYFVVVGSLIGGTTFLICDVILGLEEKLVFSILIQITLPIIAMIVLALGCILPPEDIGGVGHMKRTYHYDKAGKRTGYSEKWEKDD